MRRVKWAAALLSVIVCIGACEALLRFSMFHAPGRFASQRPDYYARSLDEFWIYTQLFSAGDPSIMTLQSDLQSDTGDEVCGFRFYKGNRFAFALRPDGILKINFAGSSVSELVKLADLEGAR